MVHHADSMWQTLGARISQNMGASGCSANAASSSMPLRVCSMSESNSLNFESALAVAAPLATCMLAYLGLVALYVCVGTASPENTAEAVAVAAEPVSADAAVRIAVERGSAGSQREEKIQSPPHGLLLELPTPWPLHGSWAASAVHSRGRAALYRVLAVHWRDCTGSSAALWVVAWAAAGAAGAFKPKAGPAAAQPRQFDPQIARRGGGVNRVRAWIALTARSVKFGPGDALQCT